MTSRRDARDLLNSVEEARTKTRDGLDPSYVDLAELMVAQCAAVLVALGHTTDSLHDIIVPAMVAAGMGLTGFMAAPDRSRLGRKIGVAHLVVPIALFGVLRKEIFGKS